jgi:membrane-associated phospholipid phosphatase
MQIHPKQLLRQFILAASLIALLTACSGNNTLKSEPGAGNWSPILLASGAAMKLPAPPQANSDAQKSEITELLSFQKQRTEETQTTVKFWDSAGTLRWNEIARNLVAKHRTDPQTASRIYALLSVAQYDALVAAWNNKYSYNRVAPEKVSADIKPLVSTAGDPVYPSEQAVLAAASATMLAYLYPDEAAFLDGKRKEHEESRLWAGVNFRSDITAGDSLGVQVAQTVVAYAKKDGSDAVWTGSIPTGPGLWFSDPTEAPLLPLWGTIKPWLMKTGDAFRPGPPPAYDSPEFKAALAEVRKISDTRTSDQGRIAAIWADNLGTYTPPGHWNAIAAKLIQEHNFSEIRAARALALLNIGLMDAGIACFDAKYYYWLIRPSQADPAITTPVGLPNFPSYISGHATFSGAAEVVLSYLFPDAKDKLHTMAEEAAMSRLYGGIHYRFDNEVGLETGRAVGELAVKRGQADGSP